MYIQGYFGLVFKHFGRVHQCVLFSRIRRPARKTTNISNQPKKYQNGITTCFLKTSIQEWVSVLEIFNMAYIFRKKYHIKDKRDVNNDRKTISSTIYLFAQQKTIVCSFTREDQCQNDRDVLLSMLSSPICK